MSHKGEAGTGPKKKQQGKPCYCPGCMIVLPLRIDKNGNPFFRCPVCALTIFMGSQFGQVAFMMIQSVIGKAPERWKEMVRRNVTLKTKADFASRMRESRATSATPISRVGG